MERDGHTENPWRQLPAQPPYFLEMDRAAIEKYNAKVNSNHLIIDWYLPEPFLGDPEAPVVLLNGNPGADFSGIDQKLHEHPDFQKANRDNLRHNRIDYPLYLLDPFLNAENQACQDVDMPGYIWWNRILKPLIKDYGLQIVAQKVFVIEFLPYHSKNFDGKLCLASQAYTFDLVAQAIQRNAVIVVMRARQLWLHKVPALKNYDNLFSVNSWQNPTISQKNCSVAFGKIQARLST